MLAAFDLRETFGKLWDGWLPVVIVVGALALCFILLRCSSRRARRSSAEAPDGARSSYAGRERGDPHSPPGDAAQVLSELKEIGREIEGRIDTRIQYLTGLLAEADRTIERLTSAVAAARDRAVSGDDPRKAEILALAREGTDPDDIARRLQLPVGEVKLVVGLARRSAEERTPP